MPKIERSVAYTFDAYSGGLEPEPQGELGNERKIHLAMNSKLKQKFINVFYWVRKNLRLKFMQPCKATHKIHFNPLKS